MPLDHSWLGREPAFPLHHMHSMPGPGLPKRKQRGGRVIQPGTDQGRWAKGEWAAEIGGYDKLLSVVTKDDVVFVPLWNGCLNAKCKDASAKYLTDGHEDLRAFIRDLAPCVHAVLLGNAGVELNFWQPAQTRLGYNRHVPEMVGFVEACAEIVIDAGGRPAFGTVDWDLAFDCYEPIDSPQAGVLARAMKACNALQICFCGYTLVPEGWCDRTFDLYSRQLPFLDERERKRPYIHLMRYLDELEVWSGCNGPEGLQHKQDVYLSFYNFKGGMYRP